MLEQTLSALALKFGQALVEDLLKGDGEDRPPSPGSLLRKAAKRGYEDVVKDLLDQGVNPNDRSSTGKTALMKAADESHLAVIGVLLENGVDVNLLGGESSRFRSQRFVGRCGLLHHAPVK